MPGRDSKPPTVAVQYVHRVCQKTAELTTKLQHTFYVNFIQYLERDKFDPEAQTGCDLFLTSSSAVPQIPLCQRMMHGIEPRAVEILVRLTYV